MKGSSGDMGTLEDNIRFIKKIMQDTKRAEVDGGPVIIFWGAIVAAAQAATYFLIVHNFIDLIWPMWAILVFTGIVITVIMTRKKARLNTFSEKLFKTVWLSFGISAAVFLFLSPMGKSADQGTLINPVISILLGMAYSLSAVINEKKMLTVISFCWWGVAVILFRFPGLHSFLIFSVSMILFQIVPGIIINREYRKELSGAKRS